MVGFFLQATVDTLAQVANQAAEGATKINAEISVLEFIFKGGFFLIPIALLFAYTIYVIVERTLYINRTTKTDHFLIKEVRTHLNNGNLELAIGAAERENNANARVVREGIMTIGRPIAEIESNMERQAQIELGEMEKKLGHLGLIAGMAPTLGFVGTISGVIKIFYSISITENISIGNISGGLYEKMISSGAGLIVGLFAYAGYHLLNGKIDHFMLNVQKQVLEFVNIIQRPNHGN
ncbi:MotA/TolQ/ExbB proton channel family protein [Flavobacterium sp. 20NA77.7]|uniref:MotA/TolQ/ExbB proton channel family protein n=1 Tax=Flavobacterium nakdongensis TaxID=3073563 RepID=A0ABY9R7Q4_9FLAO|nr:MotA/TolQ/ExbB proton channel family protein [Flavobacterium sp. 20NA77.7]WMW77300.1 MotA/TolQ/ExbB proton channel family protein [Flavobacterium sp. 20NA77.7]